MSYIWLGGITNGLEMCIFKKIALINHFTFQKYKKHNQHSNIETENVDF